MTDDPKFYYRLMVGTTITDPTELSNHLKRMIADVSANSGGVDEGWEYEVFCGACRYMVGVGDAVSGIGWFSPSCSHLSEGDQS
ncbi:MAG: hypothetical protein ACO3O3_13500 [Ilumatobacteraceae bacterium]